MVVFGVIVLIINTILYLSIFLRSGTDEKLTALIAIALATCNVLVMSYLIRGG